MSFNTIAPFYERLERIVFRNDLQRCRTAYLGKIRAPRRPLILGEGTGRFLSELLRRYPGIEVDCVDASARMLELARKHLESESVEGREGVRFLHQDITTLVLPERRYDFVVTHFFLDCFQEQTLPGIVSKLARAATPDASWLLADFRVPRAGMERLRARAWLAAMYFFFRLTAQIEASTLIDPTPFIRANGFRLAQQHLFRKGMLKSELWRRGI